MDSDSLASPTCPARDTRVRNLSDAKQSSVRIGKDSSTMLLDISPLLIKQMSTAELSTADPYYCLERPKKYTSGNLGILHNDDVFIRFFM